MPALLLLLVCLSPLSAQTPISPLDCKCVVGTPDFEKARNCSLCREAEKHPPDVEVFFLKDINPRKPNRWLALWRPHLEGMHNLHALSPDQRTRYWKAAMAKAEEMWGAGNWGLAYNGESTRTQCHLHLHMGIFITAAENSKFKVVSRVEDFPAPQDSGVWIHPVGGKFHVHLGEQITETVLKR